jgi:hypothetical protein
MIALHAVKNRFEVKLDDTHAFYLGQGLHEGNDASQLRVHVNQRGEATIQYHSRFAGWEAFWRPSWQLDNRTIETRRRAGRRAVEREQIAIHFTPKAKENFL